jgi:hypothetical protein
MFYILHIVAELPPDNTISVVFEYRASERLISAFFEWPIGQPVDCYDITISGVQLALDAHIPARPIQVDIEASTESESPSIEILQLLFGHDFADAMLHVREVKFLTATLELTRDNREEIAKAQLNTSASPPIIQEGCQAILRSVVVPEIESEETPFIVTDELRIDSALE